MKLTIRDKNGDVVVCIEDLIRDFDYRSTRCFIGHVGAVENNDWREIWREEYNTTSLIVARASFHNYEDQDKGITYKTADGYSFEWEGIKPDANPELIIYERNQEIFRAKNMECTGAHVPGICWTGNVGRQKIDAYYDKNNPDSLRVDKLVWDNQDWRGTTVYRKEDGYDWEWRDINPEQVHNEAQYQAWMRLHY